MRIVTDFSHFDESRYGGSVVALGNFDGVHLGHRMILDRAKTRAQQVGTLCSVFTFREHPKRVLNQSEDALILTSLFHKLHLLKQAGIDVCFLVDFNLSFSKQTPERFISDIIVRKLRAREICLGEGARFGHNRSGSGVVVRKLAAKHGFGFIEVPTVYMDGVAVSSSEIRSRIHNGRFRAAQSLLGRPYAFLGTVIRGSGRGAKIGFPTANLDPHNEVLPPEGVYAVWIRVLDLKLVDVGLGESVLEDRSTNKQYRAVLNYGRRPTFEDEEKAIPEVHIMDYHGSLENKTVEVTFVKRLRDERTFLNAGQLREQIEKDIRSSETLLAG